jgi:hypothetical protein
MTVHFGACLPLLALAVPVASGQALFTGETGGKGSSSLFIAATASQVRGFTISANNWTAYTRGVHSRIDAFGFYGIIAVFGQSQHYAGAGSNIGLLKRNRFGVDVSFFNLFSTPFNRRGQASAVSAAFAPIASRPVKLRGYEMTVYGGYLRGEFFGRRAGKLFTPPKGAHNGMVGTVLPISKDLSLIGEYNPGRAQHNLGLAVLYVFPRK